MRGSAKALLVAGGVAWTGGSAAPVAAADIAVIIDTAEAGAGQADLLADVLNARGYEVYDRSGADRAAMAEVLAQVEARRAETERLILIHLGETLAGRGATWLVPQGFEGESAVDAAFGAVDLDLLLGLAAAHPGRSAVVLGRPGADEAEAGATGLRPGIGTPEVPQGVALVSGPAEAVIALVRDRLMSPDATIAEALGEAPDDVTVAGFLSPDAGMVPAERGPATELPAAPEAPADPAEAAEAAIELDQAARRRIQEQLTVLGHNTRGIDGLFGPGTRGAIEAWQGSQDLEPTGFLNVEQLALLDAEAQARSAELAAAAEQARREEEAADAAFWRTTGANGSEADMRAYLARYPDGIYAEEARTALEQAEAAARAAADADDRTAWDEAAAADTREAYRGYLDAHPEGAFADRAAARIERLGAQPAEAEAADAAAANEEGLGLNRGSRALIEGQLAALGFEVGNADGSFDDATRQALRQFQTRQGLEVSGYVDEETVRALIVVSLGLR